MPMDTRITTSPIKTPSLIFFALASWAATGSIEDSSEAEASPELSGAAWSSGESLVPPFRSLSLACSNSSSERIPDSWSSRVSSILHLPTQCPPIDSDELSDRSLFDFHHDCNSPPTLGLGRSGGPTWQTGRKGLELSAPWGIQNSPRRCTFI